MSWRQEMLHDMAAAGAIGHPAVVVREDREPSWSAEARLSAQRSLGSDEREAAEEMAVNLGIRRYLIAYDASEVRVSRLDDFRALGEAIYGSRWVSALAKIMGAPLRTAQRWADGKGKGPTLDQLSAAARNAIEQGVIGDLEARIAVIRRIASMPPAAPASCGRRRRAAKKSD
jgi:hypothetical protein